MGDGKAVGFAEQAFLAAVQCRHNIQRNAKVSCGILRLLAENKVSKPLKGRLTAWLHVLRRQCAEARLQIPDSALCFHAESAPQHLKRLVNVIGQTLLQAPYLGIGSGYFLDQR